MVQCRSVNTIQYFQMGTEKSRPFTDELTQFRVEEENHETNQTHLIHKDTEKEYMLRELTFNEISVYEKSLAEHKKRQALVDPHLTNLSRVQGREIDHLCSYIYKVYALWEYPARYLSEELTERSHQRRKFQQKELWSLLASSILAMSALQKNKIRHEALTTKAILIDSDGLVKVADSLALGSTSNLETVYNNRQATGIYLSPEQCEALESRGAYSNPFKNDVWAMGMILLQCGLLQSQQHIYRDEFQRINYLDLQRSLQKLEAEYGESFKIVVELMLKRDSKDRPDWIDIEQYVRKTENSNKQEKTNVAERPTSNYARQGVQNGLSADYRPPMLNSVAPPPSYSKPYEFYPNSGVKREYVEASPRQYYPINPSPPPPPPPSHTYSQINHWSPSPNRPVSQVYIPPQPVKVHQFSNPIPQSYQFSSSIPKTTNFPTTTTTSDISKDYSNLFTNPALLRDFKSATPTSFTNYNTSFNYQQQKPGISSQISYPLALNSQNLASPSIKFDHILGSNRSSYNNQQYSLPFASDSKPQSIAQAPIKNNENDQRSKDFSLYSPSVKDDKSILSSQKKNAKQDEPEYVVETFKQGSRYEGYKLNQMRHGQGKFYYQDGGLYDGNWKCNKMDGEGALYYQSGKLAYKGNWKDDQFQGMGRLYNQYPMQLNTQFDYQNFDEIDEYWQFYEGEFVEDFKKGMGKLKLSNGQYFEGNFDNDMVQGPGEFHRLDGTIVRGVWKANHLQRTS